MKKIIFAIAVLASSVASAQVGVGNTAPKATLDVNKSSYATGEQAGIAVTQLTGAQIVGMTTTDLKAGTLVYATNTSGIINEVGYWNYNGTNWVKVGGSTTTASNGLTLTGADMALGGALSAATSINQANNNLTFTTGTARTIINGNFENKGAQYVKRTTVTTAAYSVQPDDNFILYTGTSNTVFTLPDPATNDGRMIRIANPSLFQITFPAGTINPNMTITTTDGGFCNTYICDGTYWYPLAQ